MSLYEFYSATLPHFSQTIYDFCHISHYKPGLTFKRQAKRFKDIKISSN